MPSWQADRYAEISSIGERDARAGALAPRSSARRARTSANSAATKKPLIGPARGRDEQQRGHRAARARAPLLREASSSFIERRSSAASRRSTRQRARRSVGEREVASVMPPSECVGASAAPCSSRGQDVGWWLASSAARRRARRTRSPRRSRELQSRTIASPRGATPSRSLVARHTCHPMRIVEPRPLGDRDAVRPRPRRRGHRRHARVRLSPGGARAAAGHPRRDRPGLPPGRSTPPCASCTEQGEAIYELDAERCTTLAPDLIVTQALCAVCAVSFEDVRAIADADARRSREVISLDPHTLGEVLGDVRTLAQATDSQGRGRRARRRTPRARIDRVRLAVRARRAGPRRGARVARPGVRRRPLDAAADRVRGRHRRARHAGRALRAAHVGGGRRGPAGRRRRDAVRLRRGARARAEAEALRRRARRARRAARRRGRRRGLLLPPRPAPDRRAGAARAHPASRPRARGARPRRSSSRRSRRANRRGSRASACARARSTRAHPRAGTSRRP